MRELTAGLRPHERIILAYDKSSLSDEDRELLRKAVPRVGAGKVGFQAILTRHRTGSLGFDIADYIWSQDGQVMLDVKLKDIQNTVVSAIRSIATWPRRPKIVTIHATQRLETLEAALKAAGEVGIMLAGVTLLTDHDEGDSISVYAQPVGAVVHEGAERMLAASKATGVPAALVCGPPDLKELRENPLIKITPGIREKSATPDDQNRTMTAAEAIAAGADYLVIGRPIIQAPDPLAAIDDFAQQIAGAIG